MDYNKYGVPTGLKEKYSSIEASSPINLDNFGIEIDGTSEPAMTCEEILHVVKTSVNNFIELVNLAFKNKERVISAPLYPQLSKGENPENYVGI